MNPKDVQCGNRVFVERVTYGTKPYLKEKNKFLNKEGIIRHVEVDDKGNVIGAFILFHNPKLTVELFKLDELELVKEIQDI